MPLGEIRYKLNGSEPTAKASVYTDAFEVLRATVIKAAVFCNGEPLSRTTGIDLNSETAGGSM